MEESRRLAMRRAHAKRAHYCSCGETVHGNGAKHAHKRMHERKGEWRRDFSGTIVNPRGFYYMTYSEFCDRNGPRITK